jgi:hypothetical protein
MFGPPQCLGFQEIEASQALNDSNFGCFRRLAEKQAVFCSDIAKRPAGQGDLQHP